MYISVLNWVALTPCMAVNFTPPKQNLAYPPPTHPRCEAMLPRMEMEFSSNNHTFYNNLLVLGYHFPSYIFLRKYFLSMLLSFADGKITYLEMVPMTGWCLVIIYTDYSQFILITANSKKIHGYK